MKSFRFEAGCFRQAFFVCGLAALCLAAAGLQTATAAERVADNLLVLYTFERPADSVIRDRSGSGEPLDLKIEKPQGIAFHGGRLLVTSSARISSEQPARKIAAAVKGSGGLSIEAWVKPHDTRQAGPARIVTLSADPGQRDVTLSQDAARYDVRLRTTSTDKNGIPSISSPDGSLETGLTHVVYTRDREGAARIFVNDEIGYRAAVDPATVHDLHATMLHLLGVDHKQLTYLHNGRRYRLTDVAGNVLTKILA